MKEYLKFAKGIARYAGKIMRKYFKCDNQSSYKQDNSIVTIADKQINDYLIEMVKKKFPGHCVDGEEKSFGESEYVWVCDPVDGTAMYARTIPVAVFSLALVKDGQSLVGVVYDPWTDSLYTAVKGEGAYLNGKPIHVSNLTLGDKKNVINYDMWATSDYDVYPIIEELGKQNYCVSIGSVIRGAMCVASGKFNAGIFPGTARKNCDIAAAKVIVEEAGGKVTDLFGKEQRYDQDINGALVTNGVVHDKFLKVIKKHLTTKNSKI